MSPASAKLVAPSSASLYGYANPALATTLAIVREAQDVAILDAGIRRFRDSFDPRQVRHWLANAPSGLGELTHGQRVAFLFVLDSISFCYWPEPKWRRRQNGRDLDGAWALVGSLIQAIHNGVPILQPSFLAELSAHQFDEITRGNTSIPLLEQRVAMLNELGRTIVTQFAGRFEFFIEEAQFNVISLVFLLCRTFSFFCDQANYGGRSIFFWKRAQLLASDLAFEQTLGNHKQLRDIVGQEWLSACADYKLPQVLRRLGVLQYSEGLSTIVARKEALPSESPEEVEIRACTIWAIERIRNQLNAVGIAVSAAQINDYVWLLGQTKYPGELPYHRVLTTAY